MQISRDNFICPQCGLLYERNNGSVFLLCDDGKLRKELKEDEQGFYIVCSCGFEVEINED